ncbi:MAG TPA: hypothetical protein VMJ14_14870 [Burkholderiales bacterium]|nr:hypothetical protein [Burkholderiales bacterium]
MIRQFRYSWRALAPDYAGGAGGLGIALGLLLFAHPAVPVAWVLAATAALFLVYSGRTVCRQLTHIELDETGIRARGLLGAAIRWEDLRSLRLDYYSTRRDPEGRSMQGGWMQLRLGDARRTIRVDSDLDGFAVLVGAAAQAAALRDLELDVYTVGNIQELLG